MLRNPIHRKVYAAVMLAAFCWLLFASQPGSIRPKVTKSTSATHAAKCNGSLANGDQPGPLDNEEEEDDDFNLDLTELHTSTPVPQSVTYVALQEDLWTDPLRIIFSPPPQV